jgi:hypothetical protein
MNGATPTRRGVLKGAGAGLILASVGEAAHWMTPAQAEAKGARWRTFTAEEGDLLSAFCETLAVGARAAGAARFIDHHISVPAAESLLMLRYLDVPPPYVNFYRPGLAALKTYVEARGGKPWRTLAPADWVKLVEAMTVQSPKEWPANAPPAGFVYFAVRADAVDAVYGTRAGFERLGVPYLAHLEPERDW